MQTTPRRAAAWRLTNFALAPVMALSLLAGLAAGPAPDTAPVAEITDGLVLRYKLDETSGSVAADSSGNGKDGTVNGTPTWSGGEGLTFNGSDTYVKVPNNVMAGLSSISVDFDVNISANQTGAYFIYGFGNTSTSTGYGDGYLMATGNSFRSSISLVNWTGEQNTRPASGYNLQRDAWKHVTYTQTGSTGVLYEDGVEVARNSSISILPSAIGGGTTTANYVGRSNYAGDRLFNGKIRDFRVYDRALTPQEVDTLATPTNTVAIAADKAALSLGDTSAVTANLTLPATGPNGSAVTWASGDTSVVSDSGAVTRPAQGQPNATVTLTATLKRGSLSETKTFEVTVLAMADDATNAAAAAAAVVVRNVDDVRGNLTLPSTSSFGATVDWSSSHPSVISTSGEVHRPANGEAAASVTLTATVTVGTASVTREFAATVPPLPAAQPKKGYLFSYFTGEGTANGEQIYLALSNGNNALSWREINNANPVLTSTLGTKGLRDPFIIRSPEGDKFYQIATDLKIYGNGDWDASQRTGSKSIMVWESTDLVNWTDQRLVKVSPDTAGNTWAPEAFYDPSIGAYVVFWASKLYAEDDPGHTGGTHNRMLYATTRDFHTFSEPKVWVDPGYSVIDSTMLEHDGTYYRYTKDERNNTSDTPCSKFITAEKSTNIRSLSYDFVSECIGKGSVNAGEGPLAFKSNTGDKWYMFIDEFGGRGYVPFETSDLSTGDWTMVSSYNLPSSPRHGTVLPVTAAEYDRLLQTYQPDRFANSVADVAVTTGVGQAPVLPATVPATYGDGVQRPAPVTWDPVDESDYAQVGTFTVRGTLVDNASARPTATVTVDADPVPPSHLRLHYKFDETGGTIAKDSSGRGYDGTYVRTPAWGAGVDGGSFKMAGGSGSSTTAPYVSIPNGVLKGVDNVTVSTWVKWNAGTTANEWIYGLGSDSNKYLFTGPKANSNVLYSAITTGNWRTEHRMAHNTTLPGGSWQHIAVTVNSADQTATMFLNGEQIASATGVTIKPSDLYDANKTFGGYVGKSLYAGDPFFSGEVDDFRVYDKVLSSAEILALAGKVTVDAGADAWAPEGDAAPLKGSVSVPNAPVTWSYSAGSNVDTGAVCEFSEPQSLQTSITCTDDGAYTVTLTSGGNSDSATVTVTNAAPVARAPGGHPAPKAPVATGTPVTLSVPFTDAGRNDMQSCTANWGDGTISTGVITGNTCTVSHPYAKAGVFRPQVTVSDDDGGGSTVTMPYVVTYAKGGYVAGSGWYVSPKGSLRGSKANLAVTGDADFAFYGRSGAAEGSTVFVFEAGGLRFESTAQEPASIGNSTAKFVGTGTINGAGSYGLQISVIDGDRVRGGGAVDKIRVKIWDKSTGKVIYDIKGGKLVQPAGGGIVIAK